MCDPSKKKAATSGVQQDADPGLYIYDLMSLTNGEYDQAERYKLSEALSGVTSKMDFNADL